MAQALPKSFNRAVLDSLFRAIDKGNVAQIEALCEGRHPLQVDQITRIIAPLLKREVYKPEDKQIWKTEILWVLKGPPEDREAEPPSSTERLFQLSAVVEKILTFCSYKDIEEVATVSHVFHRASLSAEISQMRDTIKKAATLSLTPESEKVWIRRYGISQEQALKEYVYCASSVTTVEIDRAFLYTRYVPLLQTHFSHAVRLFLCDQVNNLNTLLKCFPQLEHFEILAGLTKQQLIRIVTALMTHCRCLNSISLIDCQDATALVVRLAENFPKMRRVALTDCTDLRDAALIALAQYCPELETFCVSGSSSLTDASVLTVVSSNRKMKDIDVSECGNFTASPLCDLIKLSNETLKSLNLKSAKKVEIAPVIGALTAHCPPLEDINFTGHDLTDELIILLIRLSPHLMSLNLSQCRKLTDKTMREIAANCPQLTRLDVSGSQISNEGLGNLAELQNLVDINISNCALVTNAGIVSFCARKRDLVSLRSGRIFEYPATFAIANLCPKVEFLFDNHQINEMYLSDSPYLRNELIYKPVTPWGILLQASLQSLIRPDKSRLQTLLDGLTQEDKTLIYHHVWEFNGSPDEWEWGEKNALKDLHKFNTALRIMFIEMFDDQPKVNIREIEYRLADVPRIPFRQWRKESRYLDVRRADALYLFIRSISYKGP